MAIIVEDGTVITGANSYVSEAELVAYGADRGITFTGDTVSLLSRAMDYLESQPFIGNKNTKEQPLQWPRENVYIDGFYYELAEIPSLLKDAQMATAIAIGDGFDPLSTISPEVKKEKVGEIEVEYKDNTVQAAVARTISASLYKLTKGGFGLNVRVSRG